MTPEEEQRLWDYVDCGFRDLFLADIKYSDAADVRMGTFQQCAAFIDALALTYSAGVNVKGGKARRWDSFVSRFFSGGTKSALLGRYDGFRCLLLHNFSASGLAFIHGHPERHLGEQSGRTILNRESFVHEVEEAFEGFKAAMRSDADLERRALAHLDRHPPMGVWFIEATRRAPDPASGAGLSPVPLSFPLSATSLTATDPGIRAANEAVRAPRFAPSIKQKPKRPN